jgi:nuclear transport factor 2 (NTF2) superfamily protein
MSDCRAAAQRWAQTWEQAWPVHDAAAIAALYTPGASYRSHPHRAPESGGALGYTTRTFESESNVRCRFETPIVDGLRAAVQWWATFSEDGTDVTLSGTTILTFDNNGLVTTHLDYWNASDGIVD